MDFLLKIPGILIAITLHEFTKAFCSNALGDILPKRDGRMTLNPVKHFEPIGFLLFFFLGYGWGKPVKISPLYYTNRKKGAILTYSLPIIANLLLALILSILYSRAPQAWLINYYIQYTVSAVISANISIAVFNLIPVYPLAMFGILKAALPAPSNAKLIQNEKMGQLILLISMLLGILSSVLNPLARAILTLFSNI